MVAERSGGNWFHLFQTPDPDDPRRRPLRTHGETSSPQWTLDLGPTLDAGASTIVAASEAITISPTSGDMNAAVAVQGDPPATAAKKPTMEERIKKEWEADPLHHEWVVAAEILVDRATARRARFRSSFRAEGGMRIDELETYCRKCKRPIDEVEDQPCEAKINNEHLIGGDQSTRAKRKIPPLRGPIVYGVIDRRNRDGYSVHAGK